MQTHDNTSTQTSLLLSRYVQLTKTQYASVEALLLDIINDTTLAFAERMIACRFALKFVESMVEIQTGKFQPMQQPRELVGANDRLFSEILNALSRQKQSLLFPLAQKQVPAISARVMRRILLGFLATHFAAGRKPTTRWNAIKVYAIFGTGIGSTRLVGIADKVAIRKLQPTHLPTLDDLSATNICISYAQKIIRDRTQFRTSTIQRGLDCLITVLSLVRWYAAALSTNHSITDAHAYEQAIALCDEHTPLLSAIDGDYAIATLFDRLTDSPHFPYYMLR